MLTTEIIIRFFVNLFAIWLFAYQIYYRRHHDQPMLLLLLAINLFIFPIIQLNLEIEATFGFTLFALLALVRMRSKTLTKTEIAYLFGSITLSVTNAMLPDTIATGVANVLILGVIYIGDHPSIWKSQWQQVEVRWSNLPSEMLLNPDLLIDKLSKELQIDVNHIIFERVYVDEGNVRMMVYYNTLTHTEREKIKEESSVEIEYKERNEQDD